MSRTNERNKSNKQRAAENGLRELEDSDIEDSPSVRGFGFSLVECESPEEAAAIAPPHCYSHSEAKSPRENAT